jgi:hypothetical protein
MTSRFPIFVLGFVMAPIVAYGQGVATSQTTGIAPDRFMGGVNREADVRTAASPRNSTGGVRTHKTKRDGHCRGC